MDIFTSEQISTLIRITADKALDTHNEKDFSSLCEIIGTLGVALEIRLDIEEGVNA